ncbi:amidase domain-containing protein [Sarocladium implicatum]|nr:amidase domain-containing protein [Sarocladium implicatum]
MAQTDTWQSIAQATQSRLAAKIPAQWRLSDEILQSSQKDVSDIPRTCGLLTERELDITIRDSTYILEQVHSAQYSAEEVCLAFCKRSAIVHQLVNCLTEICYDEALELAQKQDAHFKETGKVVGPLHGLPISVKDHVNVAGLRSTLGYCSWADNIASEDAVFVQALRNAGAIIFVKTTMPVTGMALETVSHLFGRTTCGFNRKLVSGGSSGGEGALVGLHGSPMGVGTDVAGSTRIPCAFNSIYGIRPSTRRLSYDGVLTSRRGARGIAPAIGPMCHSVRDMELICKLATEAKPWQQDPLTIAMPWVSRPQVPSKLCIGLLKFDGVVMPHPPVLRGLEEAAAKLRSAGHEVIEFTPYQHQRAWDIAFPLYYTTGAKEIKSHIAATNEPWFPAVEGLHTDPILHDLTSSEIYDLQAAQDDYKKEYLKHWDATAKQTSTAKPIDALLCPINPCASYPHDTLTWWGYSAQWNLLDYPGVIIPGGFTDKAKDVPNKNYSPIGPADKENHELYDPELWHGGPIGLQLIAKQFEDERLLAVSAEVDRVVNGALQV